MPQLEHRLVIGGIDADPAAVDDAGDAETVHLGEEFFGAVDLLRHGRLRQLIEDLAERVAVGDHDAGRLVVAAALELAAGRDIGIVMDVERFHRLRRQQQPVIEMLDVDGIVGGCGGHLARRSGGASRQTAPRSSRRRPRSRSRAFAPAALADFLQRLLQGGHADPVHLGGKRLRGADAMDVAVGQAGNHGAAAEIDQFCLAHRRVSSSRPCARSPAPRHARSPAPAESKNPCRR